MKKRGLGIVVLLILSLLVSACGGASGGASSGGGTTKVAESDIAGEVSAGIDYWYGINGSPYAMEKASVAFQKAADAGDADAWYWLGALAKYGVDADRWTQVNEYYTKSADAGSACGLYGLGTLYQSGKGAVRDYNKAAEYYQKAVDGGYLMGYLGLGGLYTSGHGVDEDGAKAIEMYEKALESDDWVTVNAARCALGSLYLYGASGLEADNNKAMEWFRKAADDDYVEGFHGMGMFYNTSIAGGEPDYTESAKWYTKAAEHGMPYNLAVAYTYGKGVKADPEYAVELYKQAENGGREACSCLAALAVSYLQGQGVKANSDSARDYAEKALAADPGSIKAEGSGVGLANQVLDALG